MERFNYGPKRKTMKVPSIPPNIARWMSPEDRAKYELDEPIGSEAVEQGKFAKWLKDQWELGRLEYFWQRLDKKATGKPGTPDFVIALPKSESVWIEFKSVDGELSPPQAATKKNLNRLGHTFYLAFCAREAIHFVSFLQAELTNL
jgi:hypothetical protein